MKPSNWNALSPSIFFSIQLATIGFTALLCALIQPSFWQGFNLYMLLLFPLLLFAQAFATHLCYASPWRKRLSIWLLQRLVVQEVVLVTAYLLYATGVVIAVEYMGEIGRIMGMIAAFPLFIVTVASLLARCCSFGMLIFIANCYPRTPAPVWATILPVAMVFLVTLMGLLLALGVGYIRVSGSYRLWQQQGRTNGWLGLALLMTGAALRGGLQRKRRFMLSSTMRYSSQGFSLRQRSSSNAGFQ